MVWDRSATGRAQEEDEGCAAVRDEASDKVRGSDAQLVAGWDSASSSRMLPCRIRRPFWNNRPPLWKDNWTGSSSSCRVLVLITRPDDYCSRDSDRQVCVANSGGRTRSRERI
jgi:hypothetical protein